MEKPCKIGKLGCLVTFTFSMSASYDFGDTPCPVCRLPIISHLLKPCVKYHQKSRSTTFSRWPERDPMTGSTAGHKNRKGNLVSVTVFRFQILKGTALSAVY